MKLLCMFAALLACVCAQEWYSGDEQAFVDNSCYFTGPEASAIGEYQYRLDQLRKQRDRRPKRQVTGSIPVGDNGKLIGTLGDTAKGGLYGTGAYEHTLINNDGGRLAAQAYGTRVLNPNRDSTYYGGKLDWSNSNAHASADVRQRIGGRARMELEAGGKWEPFKNSDITAGGYFSHREGRPSDYGGRAIFNYRF